MANDSQTNIKVIPAEDINKRFDRIESKIDKLSDAMVTLARTEQKIMSMEAEKNNITERLNRHSEKLDDIAEKVADNVRTVAMVNRITWAVVAAVVGVLVKSFMGV